MRGIAITFLVVTTIDLCAKAEESAQYLQNAIRDLRNMKGRQSLRRVDTMMAEAAAVTVPAPVMVESHPVAERRIQNSNNGVPPLSLTKGELAALYEAAVSKGDTVKLNTGDNSYVHAAVHELDDSSTFIHEHKEPPPPPPPPKPDDNNGDTSGYYYYYYPLKSFVDEMTSSSSSEHHYKPSPSSHHHDYHEFVVHTTTEHPHFQYHSHTHQHNVKITKEVEKKDHKKKALEPLFMAISGFIGMAVMFILSVLVFPKFGKAKPKVNIKKSDRINDIARVALEAIEGKDCAERFACELGKTARAFNWHENRFVKLIKRMAPTSFGKQIEKVGKYTTRRLKCTAIPCRKKTPPKKKPNNNAGAQKKH